jgi:hypothetical protein
MVFFSIAMGHLELARYVEIPWSALFSIAMGHVEFASQKCTVT